MEFSQVIRDRCSIRHYDSQRIDDAVIAEIVEEAAWAPSAGNTQPWKLVVLSGEALRRFLARFESDAVELVLPGAKGALLEAAARRGRHVDPASLNQIVTEVAPRYQLAGAPPSHLLIVFHERSGLAASLRTMCTSASLVWFRLRRKVGFRSKARYLWLMLSHWCQYVTAAYRVRLMSVCNYVYALTLSACDRGIDSCIIAAFNPSSRAIRRFVGLSSRDEIVAAVALGYRKSADAAAHSDRGRWAVAARWLERDVQSRRSCRA